MTETLERQSAARLLAIGKSDTGRTAKLDLLRQTGYLLEDVETAEAAIGWLSRGTFGLALVDCPTLDSATRDICERLRQLNPVLPILVTAGTSGSSLALNPASVSFDAYLVEPVSHVQLTIFVKTLLRLGQKLAAEADAAASAALHAKLASLYAASIDAVATIDKAETISSWNKTAERLFGFTAAEVIGTSLLNFAGNADLLAERRRYLTQLWQGEPVEFQAARQRKNGDQIEIWARAAPMTLANGEIIGATFIIRDITAQKQRDQHVHFLMRELTHRSKNLLAVIQAMARQSLSHLSSPEEFVIRFSERLSGLAGSHDLLSNVDWEGASLVDLIRSQLRHYEDRFEEKIHLHGPNLFLRPEAAQNIGIALHELSTNAAKYGALSVPGGHVSITWDVKGEPGSSRLSMTWQEKGGPAVRPPGHKGFGHVVMDRITGQALGGTSKAEFTPDGVTWRLDVPAHTILTDRDKP